MKKVITVAAYALFMAQAAIADGTIKVGGSTICEATLLKESNGDAIKKSLEADKIAMEVSSSSSGDGLQDLVDDKIKISLNSGGDSVYKKVTSTSADKYPMTPLAKGKIVFVVHPNNPVKELTAQQIKDVFSKGGNWKDFGEGEAKGKDQKIISVSEREEGGMFNHLNFTKSSSENALMMGSGAKIINAVATDETAIGYAFILDGGKSDALKDVKILKVESTDDFKLDVELTAITKGAPSEDMKKVIEAIKKVASPA